jgi:hypothetical protein
MLNIGRHLVARLEQWWDGVRLCLFLGRQCDKAGVTILGDMRAGKCVIE